MTGVIGRGAVVVGAKQGLATLAWVTATLVPGNAVRHAVKRPRTLAALLPRGPRMQSSTPVSHTSLTDSAASEHTELGHRQRRWGWGVGVGG